MTVLMRARNLGNTRWITWSANAADYDGVHAPEPILLNSAILEIIFGAAASKVDNDSTVEGIYVSDALDYLNQHGGGITGPEVTTDNALVRWDGTDGYFVKNSVVTLNEIGGLNLGTDGYIEIGNSVSSVGDVRLDLGGYINGIVNGGIEIYGADGDTGGAINLLGGQSNADDIPAPAITIQAGDGIGNVVEGWPKGGNVEISAGDSTNYMGGIVTIFGGSSANSTPFFDPFYGGTIRIVAGPATIGHGGDVFVDGGLTSDITETAGNVYITGGITYLAGGEAGSVTVSGGSSSNGTSGTAGLVGGNGAVGGAVSINSGASTAGNGANITIWAGDTFGNGYDGGNIDIQSGTSYTEGNGGSITIQAKEGKGAGDGGDVIIQSGAAVDTGSHGNIEIRAYQGTLTVWGHGGTNIYSQENSGYINLETEHANITINNNEVIIGFGEITNYGQSVFYDGYFAVLDEREIRWYGGDGHYSGFQAATNGTTQIWILPEDDGPDGYVLTTDGSGNLSWSEGGGSGTEQDLESVLSNGNTTGNNYIIIENDMGLIGSSVTPSNIPLVASNYDINHTGGAVYINKGDVDAGGNIQLQAGFSNFDAEGERGGNISIYSGDALNTGGHMYIAAGNSNGDSGNSGGSIQINSGHSHSNIGGNLTISSGNGYVRGGLLTIQAGDNSTIIGEANDGDGGSLVLLGGDSTLETGGDVQISAGSGGAAAGVGGDILISSGSGNTIGTISLKIGGVSSPQHDALIIDNDKTATFYGDGYFYGDLTCSVGGDLSGTLPNPSVVDLSITGEEQGSVLYFDGSNWVQLPPGEDGYALITNGTGADPTWGTNLLCENITINGDGYFGGTAYFNQWPTLTPTAGAVTVDFSSYQQATITLNAATVTITFIPPGGPTSCRLLIIQDGGGGNAIAFENGSKPYAPDGTLDIAAAASARTLVGIVYDGTDFYAVSSQPMEQVA